MMVDAFSKLRHIFKKQLVDGLVYYNTVVQDVIIDIL